MPKDLKDLPQFVGLLVSAVLLVWLFVWQQRELIADPATFGLILTLLLALSFWTSATEAAYAVVSSLGAPTALTNKMNAAAKQLSEAAADPGKLITNPDQADNRRLKRLVSRHRTFSSQARDGYVGAFASASVFLNTALVAFVPAALATESTPTTLKKYLETVAPAWQATLSGSRWLTFVSTTLLLLIAGKIVPKMVGFAVPYLFTYRLAVLADVVHFLCGWIARGTKFPFARILEGDNRRFGD